MWTSKSASEGLGQFFFFLSKFHSFTKIFLQTITAHPTPSHSLSITFSRQLLILMNWHLKLIVWHKTTSKLAFIFCQSLHKAYRRVCCKEPLSFGWRITSLVSFGFAPCNLHCYGKPLDLDRAQNHWGQHNRVWQVPFSNLFGSKIKIPGKVDPWSIESILYSFENRCCEWTCNEVWNICIDMDCTCRGWEAETSDLYNVRKHVMGYKSTGNGSCQIQFWFQLVNYYKLL